MWKAGLTAHLDVDAHDGKAWVGLRVQLGHVPGPAPHQVYPSFPKTSLHLRRGPAYQRRQERRQAARTAQECSPPTAEDFPCLICDFSSNWKNGVEIHMARKHSTIDQTDGIISFYLLEIGLTISVDIFTTLSSNRTKVPVVMRVMLVESDLMMMMSSLFWMSSL